MHGHLKSIVNKICYDNGSSMRHNYETLFDNIGQPIFYDIFLLKLRPESKVTVTLNDIRHSLTPRMCPQTQFGIPISYNIGFMLVTRFF